MDGIEGMYHDNTDNNVKSGNKKIKLTALESFLCFWMSSLKILFRGGLNPSQQGRSPWKLNFVFRFVSF